MTSPQPVKQSRFRFRLSTLMLSVTIIAVGLGIATWVPGLAIGFAIVVAFALVRHLSIVRRTLGVGLSLSTEDKVLRFFASLAIASLIACSSAIAFYATCWAIVLAQGPSGYILSYYSEVGLRGYLLRVWRFGLSQFDGGFVAGVIVGLLVGILAMVLTCFWLWPYQLYEERLIEKVKRALKLHKQDRHE